MTYLELVNRLREEILASGNPLTTLQGTLPRDATRQKQWIATAWRRIQSLHTTWNFRRLSSSHSVSQYSSVQSPTEYLANEVSAWLEHTFRLAADGDNRAESWPIDFLPYEDFINGIGEDPANYQKPYKFTIRPHDNAIILGPAADAAYELFYDYTRTVQDLSADDDVPICPEDYHDAIVYRAMMMYGRANNAPEIYDDGRLEYRRVLGEMMHTQLPQITLGVFVG